MPEQGHLCSTHLLWLCLGDSANVTPLICDSPHNCIAPEAKLLMIPRDRLSKKNYIAMLLIQSMGKDFVVVDVTSIHIYIHEKMHQLLKFNIKSKQTEGKSYHPSCFPLFITFTSINSICFKGLNSDPNFLLIHP